MKIQLFLSKLFAARIDYHIMHLQTELFAKHLALDDLYKNIVEYTDRIAETFQGENGIIKGYSSSITLMPDNSNPVEYTKKLISDCRTFRKSTDQEEIKAIVDELVEFLNGNLYKLKSLS